LNELLEEKEISEFMNEERIVFNFSQKEKRKLK